MRCDGGCRCGAVRYRFDGEPLTLYACHCTNCQTRTGSACSMNLVVLSADIELLQGEPVATPYAADKQWCAQCGVRLWAERERLPGVRWLAAGTLDDNGWLEPVAHCWIRSAQPWVTIPAGVARYETQPDDPSELLQVWQRAQAAAD